MIKKIHQLRVESQEVHVGHLGNMLYMHGASDEEIDFIKGKVESILGEDHE